jgi:hypothetical protein
MSESAGGKPVLRLRLWVPAEGGFRDIAGDLAAKAAEYLGTAAPDARSLVARVESLAARVANGGGSHDITFEFRQDGGDLVIEARGGRETFEVRHPLPA